ncbi:right-handed parallel beta-helix repeat-containing protein [Pseudoduganella aquatica]|uniref:right-handed parallel beta-helix repeat-containing protein n=1 Tax=Pseudoduganella aquatica TaxID=2660641 RepID=UPI001E552628|nr:right-handed parallel beta-helix repeat-containing protein [Pseudoduganella aquatica]
MKTSIRLLPLLLGSLFACSLAHSADFYVSENGNDKNDGKSPNTPFLTLQHADGALKPGDTVWVMAGTYRSARSEKDATALLEIRSSGKPDAWITWRAYPGARPELVAQGVWHAILLNASYIKIDGLTLTGNNGNVRQADAEANGEMDLKASLAAWKAEGEMNAAMDDATPDQGPGAASAPKKPQAKPRSLPKAYQRISPLCSANGISADFRGKKEFHHHYVLSNLVVRDFGTGGINMMDIDYYTIENSEVYNNAWYSPYGGSGISQLRGRDFDQASGYHNIIRNNRVYNNKCLVRLYYLDLFSDGNGIILDSLYDYAGATLVENLSYNNGGAGIHVFRSHKARIDIVNNTVWRNQQMWRLYDIGAHDATNINILNNIVVADKYRQVNGKPMAGVRYDHNLYFGSPQVEAKGPNDRFADPLLALPSTNRKDGDFSLLPGSPAIDSAGRRSGASFPPQASSMERK